MGTHIKQVKATAKCSFCDRDQSQVRRLIAVGQARAQQFICDECVAACVEEIADADNQQSLREIRERLDAVEREASYHCGATGGLMELFNRLFCKLIEKGVIDPDSYEAKEILSLRAGYDKHGSGYIPSI